MDTKENRYLEFLDGVINLTELTRQGQKLKHPQMMHGGYANNSIVYSVTRPLNKSEAAVDHALIKTSLLLFCKKKLINITTT